MFTFEFFVGIAIGAMLASCASVVIMAIVFASSRSDRG